MLKGFQIVCCSMDVPPVVRVFLSFFSTEVLPNKGWVTMCPLLYSYLLKPFMNPYEDWKDEFVWVRGRGNALSLLQGRKEILFSHIMDIGSLNYQRDRHYDLSPLEKEAIHILKCFHYRDTHTLITWDPADENGGTGVSRYERITFDLIPCLFMYMW